MLTDADGRFLWDDAPSDEVTFRADAIGYGAKDDVTLNPGEHTIVLDRKTTLKGTVVDAETGRPIPKFSLTMATVKLPGERPIWQRGFDLERPASPSSRATSCGAITRSASNPGLASRGQLRSTVSQPLIPNNTS